MNLKKKLTPGVVLTLSWGCIHEYDRCSKKKVIAVYLRSQVSVYRTIGPLVSYLFMFFGLFILAACISICKRVKT